MVKKHAATTDNAPEALGPYSMAIAAGQLVFASGQLGIDPKTGEFAGANAAQQAHQVLTNIQAVLGSMDLDMDSILDRKSVV